MSFTKVAPAGIGTSPGTSIRIGDSLLHSTGLDIGTGSGIGVTIRQHGNATFTGIITAASFSGNATSATTAGTVTTAAQPNITSVGTLSSLNVSGNLGVGGTVTYEDVTNIDSVGIVTAREGVFLPDDKQLKLGNTAGSPDLKIYHSSGINYIDASNGHFALRGTGNDNILYYTSNGDVEIYDNGNKKLETSSSGVTVTGTLTATTFSGSGVNLTNLDASDLASGTIPDARFPAVLPSVSGVNLTGVSGFSTALGNTQGTLENLIFKTTESFTVGTGQSVRVESDNMSGNTTFTRLSRIIVSTGATFHVSSGTTFIMNVLEVF